MPAVAAAMPAVAAAMPVRKAAVIKVVAAILAALVAVIRVAVTAMVAAALVARVSRWGPFWVTTAATLTIAASIAIGGGAIAGSATFTPPGANIADRVEPTPSLVRAGDCSQPPARSSPSAPGGPLAPPNWSIRI